jgi:hypothetical protein
VATLVALAVAVGAPATADGAAQFLSVGPASGPAGIAQIVDASRRVVLLKGVNVDGLVDYFRPDLATSYPTAAGQVSAR